MRRFPRSPLPWRGDFTLGTDYTTNAETLTAVTNQLNRKYSHEILHGPAKTRCSGPTLCPDLPQDKCSPYRRGATDGKWGQHLLYDSANA